MSSIRSAALGLAFIAVLPATAVAQALPPGVYAGERDASQATAGSYNLDGMHASVLAKVSHLSYSYSVFRFDKVQGTLGWDPAAPTRSSLSVQVDTASVTSNVPGFAEEIADKFLQSKQYPQATFVSSAFRQTDPLHGQVDGQFTLMGKTKPVTFEVTLVGAGKGFGGKPRLGVEAKAKINPNDYGLPPMFGAAIELVVDTEFEHQ